LAAQNTLKSFKKSVICYPGNAGNKSLRNV